MISRISVSILDDNVVGIDDARQGQLSRNPERVRHIQFWLNHSGFELNDQLVIDGCIIDNLHNDGVCLTSDLQDRHPMYYEQAGTYEASAGNEPVPALIQALRRHPQIEVISVIV